MGFAATLCRPRRGFEGRAALAYTCPASQPFTASA